MSLRIRRFEPGDTPAIERLNARLARGGVSDVVYPEAEDQPSEERGDPLTQESWVAADDGEVRGGVWLHEHEFSLRGRTVRAGWLKYPVSESLIDRAFAGVAGGMVLALLRRQPRLMALGMGGIGGPLARLVAGLRWRVVEVPFFLAPIRPRRIFRALPRLRGSHGRALLADTAAWTGAASLALAPWTLRRRIGAWIAARGDARVEEVDGFAGWTDAVWAEHRGKYPFLARRDGAMLERVFPPSMREISRLRIARNDRTIGWMATKLLGGPGRPAHPAFGTLRVGMLVDGLSDPADATTMVALGTRHLERAGAELVVCNHTHPAWQDALRRLAFVRAPGNFAFAYSREMASLLSEAGVSEQGAESGLFLNRGDCDGPPDW